MLPVWHMKTKFSFFTISHLGNKIPIIQNPYWKLVSKLQRDCKWPYTSSMLSALTSGGLLCCKATVNNSKCAFPCSPFSWDRSLLSTSRTLAVGTQGQCKVLRWQKWHSVVLEMYNSRVRYPESSRWCGRRLLLPTWKVKPGSQPLVSIEWVKEETEN